MASSDIKHLLDSIIGEKEDSPKEDGTGAIVAKAIIKPQSFNSDNFREKLSLCVLKDIICAMMHDETKDLDSMIDDSITRHIHNDYKGTCFGYLCKARDRLQSPILGNIIQELNTKVKMVKEGVEEGSPEASDAVTNPEQTTADILNTVDNYDDLRAKLKEEVSKKVVNDVAKVITKSNDAPVFDNIDTKLKKVDNTNDGAEDKEGNPENTENQENTEQTDAGVTSNNQEDASTEVATPPDANATASTTTSESLILRMTGNIVTEYACNRKPISTDEGMNRAIITFCIGEMDALFNYDRARTIVTRYL